MFAENKDARWEASTTVAVDTNWFTSNITTANTGFPSKFTLQIMVPTSTVVEVDMTDGTTAKAAISINGGTALTASTWYIFDIIVPGGYSFNVQHKTTTQNPVCIVSETSKQSDI